MATLASAKYSYNNLYLEKIYVFVSKVRRETLAAVHLAVNISTLCKHKAVIVVAASRSAEHPR